MVSFYTKEPHHASYKHHTNHKKLQEISSGYTRDPTQSFRRWLINHKTIRKRKGNPTLITVQRLADASGLEITPKVKELENDT